jgi:hypothetical protein
LTQYLLLE